MDEKDLCWLAGFLEGEGSFIAATKTNPHPCIQVMTTDEDVIARASRLFGTKHSGPHWPSASGPVKPTKPRWTARLNGAGAVQLMRRLFPLMGERRQMQIVRAIYSWDGDRRTKVSERVGAMIRKYLAEGVSFNEIARRLPIKITPGGVVKWARRNGCHPVTQSA
jgi:hypothetical protein